MLKKIILPNGLRLLLIPQPKSVAATALVLVSAGSEYETKNINGLSHFLEHMMFKGTEKRPKPSQIAEELDSMGARYNAFTDQEYTGYWAKAEAHKLPQILELVSDLYLHPIFDPAEIKKESGVIVEEINMYEDMPMEKVNEVFGELLYGDQPAGWSVAGTKNTVKKLTREDFLSYRSKHYVGPATVVAIAGKFNPAKTERDVRKLFGSLSKKAKAVKPRTKESQSRPRVKLSFKESDQSHLILGVRAFSVFHPKKYPLEILGSVLGGGMSSRLFKRVREEMGAAYYIRAGEELSLDHGVFAVSSGVNHGKLEIVIKAILEEMDRLRREPVSKEELRRVKDHLIGNFLISLETSDRIASYYGADELILGKQEHPETVVKKVEAVSSGDIQAVARQIFRDKALNLALVGPHKTDKHLRKLLCL